MTFGLLLVSCDTYNYIHYTVENNTNDSLQLTYTFGDSYFATQATDTTVILPGNRTDTLFIFVQISPSVYDPEDGDHMIYISNTEIMRLRDGMKIKKDVTLRKNWHFIETGKNSALMQFTINENDF